MAKKKPRLVTQDSGKFLDNLTSLDGYRNAVTGMGIMGRDKGEATEFGADGRLDRQTLDEMGRSDGLASRIVNLIVDDAMRSGWVVNFESDEDEDIGPEDAQEFNKQLQKWHKNTGFKKRISQHLKQSRLQGGSLLTLGASDGQPASEPLDPTKVESFSWFRAHDRHQVSSSGEIDDDPESAGFGFPKTYTLHSAHASQLGTDRDKRLLDTAVHNSRVWRTDGTILSDRVRIQNGGWGDSVLEVCNEPLANHGSSMKSTRTIVQEWVQGVYKIKNLQGLINANGEAKLKQRFHLMDWMKSMWQAIMIEADVEDYERKVVTAAGLPEVLDRFMIHLAAVSGIPVTKLFGVSPGGFGTGEAEGDNWDDQVKSYQTDVIEPLLEYVYGILFQTPEFESFPDSWSIKFNSLQLTDPIEEAEIRLKTAQADSIDIASAVLDPDEVAISRYGGSTYSTDTVLNQEAREMDAALESEPGEMETTETGLSVIGEKISDVISVLKDVSAGALAAPAAETLLTLAYPNVDAAEFKRLVSESAKLVPPPAPRAPEPSSGTTPDVGAAEGASGSESSENGQGASDDKEGT